MKAKLNQFLIKEMNDGFFLRKETARPQSTGYNKMKILFASVSLGMTLMSGKQEVLLK